MVGKKKLIVVFAALMFSLGIFSVGFGYWTDQLNIEGDANVKLSINVTDDIINVEYTTSDAVQLIENQTLPDHSGTGENSSNSIVDSTAPISPAETPADFSDPEEQPSDFSDPAEQPADSNDQENPEQNGSESSNSVGESSVTQE